MIKVAIVDDHTVLCESLKYIIEKDDEFKVVAIGKNGREALTICEKFSPDILLMDISMPVCDGIEGTRLVKSKYSTIKVLILTTFEDEDNITNAIKNGADGYMLKDVEPEILRASIKSAIQGLPVIHKSIFKNIFNQYLSCEGKSAKPPLDANLTSKELEIIKHIVEGKSNKEIASILNLSEGRVRNILTDIFGKFHLLDRTQLAVYAVKNKLV